MLSSQRAGSTTKILAPSQTQDLWTETGFEQESDARREARFRGMSNAGFHRAALSQLQQEFNPDTPMPIGVSVNASQRGPSGEATKSTTVMASAVSNQTPQQQQQQHEEQSQMSVAVSVSKPMTPLELKQERQRLKNIQSQQEHERQLESQRISRVRQQRINWYRRPKADNMPTEERRAARERLYKTPMHVQPRDKAPTNTGHFLMNGELSPTYEKAGRNHQVGRTPKSRGGVSRDPQQSHRGSQQSHRGGGQMVERRDRDADREQHRAADGQPPQRLALATHEQRPPRIIGGDMRKAALRIILRQIAPRIARDDEPVRAAEDRACLDRLEKMIETISTSTHVGVPLKDHPFSLVQQ